MQDSPNTNRYSIRWHTHCVASFKRVCSALKKLAEDKRLRNIMSMEGKVEIGSLRKKKHLIGCAQGVREEDDYRDGDAHSVTLYVSGPEVVPLKLYIIRTHTNSNGVWAKCVSV